MDHAVPCHVLLALSGPCSPSCCILVCPAWSSCERSWCRRWAGLAWASGASGSVVCRKKNKSALRGWFCQVRAASAPRPWDNPRLRDLGRLSGAPSATHVFPRHPRLGPAAHARSGPVHAGAEGKWMRARARDGLAQARQGALVSIARWARARCHSGAFIRRRQGRNELV